MKKAKYLIMVLVAVLVVITAINAVMIISDCRSVKVKNDSLGIIITEGDTVSSVVDLLYDEGIVNHPLIFKLVAKMEGYDTQIKPGAAEITSGMSYNEILALLSEDNRNSEKLVIPEGYELKQIKELIVEKGYATGEEFDAALNPADYDYRFLKQLPERENQLEGYLFPSTYDIAEGMTAHDIINMMLSEFDEQFTDEFYSRAAQMNYSVDEIITMASIIERETDAETERAKVAGVFYNRINQNMRLQSCATVQYILGERKAVLSVADTQIASPYNTYMNDGLPVGPICNPGLECIEAALYPEDTDALYFVAGADGKHIFSRTYEEHLAAMSENEPKYNVEGN